MATSLGGLAASSLSPASNSSSLSPASDSRSSSHRDKSSLNKCGTFAQARGRTTMKPIDPKRTPRLHALVLRAAIQLDGQTYIGRAGDGEIVELGTVGDERQLERYLETHPSPTDW